MAQTSTPPATTPPLHSPRLVVSRVPVPVLDHLNDPATLIPTAPDLTLILPRTPTNEPSSISSTPAPSLALNIDTAPLSISFTEGEPHCPDSIKPIGDEPSNDKNQNESLSSSRAVSDACESVHTRKGPWGVLGRLAPDSRPANQLKQSLVPSLANKLRPNQPHSTFSPSNAHPARPSLNRSQSVHALSSTPSSPPPALSPPRADCQPSSHTTRSKPSKRVSAWFSPMKYDADAAEIQVMETGEIGTRIKISGQEAFIGTQTGAPKLSIKKLRRSTIVSGFVSLWAAANTPKPSRPPSALIVDDVTSFTEDEEPLSSRGDESPKKAQLKVAKDPIENTLEPSLSKQTRLLKQFRTIKIKQIW